MIKEPNPGSGEKHWWRNKAGIYRHETPAEMGRITKSSWSPFYKMLLRKEQPHRSFHGWQATSAPPPGSDEAIRFFCSCPVLDNRHGLGAFDGKDDTFWITQGCPLHDPESKVGLDG